MPFPESYLYDNLLEEFKWTVIMNDGALVMFVDNQCSVLTAMWAVNFTLYNFYVDLLSKYEVYIMLCCMHGLQYNLIPNKENLAQLDTVQRSGLCST